MATHGRARQTLIADLRAMAPKLRTCSAMSATPGADDPGRMPSPDRDKYVRHCERGEVRYTVRSYATVIAYVLDPGDVVVPDVRYSATTNHHQHLCRTYLNGGLTPAAS